MPAKPPNAPASAQDGVQGAREAANGQAEDQAQGGERAQKF